MTAVAYAMRDHAPTDEVAPGAVSVPVTSGGCGKSHQATTDAAGHVCYECDQCAPVLAGGFYGFAATPAGVPLTCDEIANRELARRDAEVSQNVILKGITEHFLATMSAGSKSDASPVARTLVEQVGEMSDGQRIELAKALAALADDADKSKGRDGPKAPSAAKPRAAAARH